MRSQTRPTVRETRRRPCGVASGGFTLIEMIGVFAVLMIIAGIIFSIVPGALRQANVDKAEAELQVIQHALETYRARFGEYPRPPRPPGPDPDSTRAPTDAEASAYLASALNGLIDPAGNAIALPAMINNSVLTYEGPGLPHKTDQGVPDNRILDPWGRPYVYHSAKPGFAENQSFGYELHSLGPDGKPATPDDIQAQ